MPKKTTVKNDQEQEKEFYNMSVRLTSEEHQKIMELGSLLKDQLMGKDFTKSDIIRMSVKHFHKYMNDRLDELK